MARKKPQLPTELVTVTIDKLVHGGQGLGTLDSGQKIFVWNTMPGEQVQARIIKKKKNYLEAVAEEIIEPSIDRLEPLDANYLSTSPWQIVPLAIENDYKAAIVRELFAHEHITLPEFTVTSGQSWQYRNKMEYSFWGDEAGLHLALHERGSHGKQVVEGSSLAMPTVDVGANGVLAELQKISDLRAGDLKTIIIRAQQDGQAVGALFVKQEKFPALALPAGLKGLRIYYSNPKSPASVTTKLLHEVGDTTLVDTIGGSSLAYDVVGFFQVNLPIFEQTLTAIDRALGDAPSIDMYSGVGSIGIPLKSRALIEIDLANIDMAKRNTTTSEVIHASSESAIEYITGEDVVIVDPPRAGLHADVTQRLLEKMPPTICYLSCNPATQARDIALLQEKYEITSFALYNYFPHTPHIETLAILSRKP